MHEIIRKIHIPERPRTGIIEEREVFARMEADQRRQRKQARRARVMAALGLRRSEPRRKRS